MSESYYEEEQRLIKRREEIQKELTEISDRLNKFDLTRVRELAEEMLQRIRAQRQIPLTEEEQKILDTLTSREDCAHIKGGMMRPLGADSAQFVGDKYAGSHLTVKDFNVSTHRYPNGRWIIKCLTCGKNWTKDSPDWEVAKMMSQQSSNTQSSSEIGAGVLLR